jgi:hypothetical protein
MTIFIAMYKLRKDVRILPAKSPHDHAAGEFGKCVNTFMTKKLLLNGINQFDNIMRQEKNMKLLIPSFE